MPECKTIIAAAKLHNFDPVAFGKIIVKFDMVNQWRQVLMISVAPLMTPTDESTENISVGLAT